MAAKATKQDLKGYWRENLTYVGILLVIWFTVSCLFGVIMADTLDHIKLGGFPLGFWFANQGSEVTFVILIFVYTWLMNKLDKKYNVHEE